MKLLEINQFFKENMPAYHIPEVLVMEQSDMHIILKHENSKTLISYKMIKHLRLIGSKILEVSLQYMGQSWAIYIDAHKLIIQYKVRLSTRRLLLPMDEASH